MTLLLLSACLSTDLLVPPTVDEDPNLPTLALDDTLLHGELLGDPGDPLLVLLHGGPASDSAGLAPLTALSERGWQVLIYDQRGGGLSRRHDPDSLDAWTHADDLAALIEAYSPDGQADLVAHSWGGQLAAITVGQHPERVRAVVLLDPGPYTGERLVSLGLTEVDMSAPHLNERMWEEQMLSPDDHARMDLHFLQLLGGQMPGYHMREEDPMPFRRMGAVAYTDVINAVAGPDGLPAFDFRPGLADWTGPVHYVWGGANETMDLDYRAAQEADWPPASAITLEGVGHDLPWIAAETLISHIDEVL
ncbi:MAG: alpha/beta hydrolase [Alphaproteobacteria bacterium]|nr:alpha/beta hydrolase [Alphaproteobacteria bacterium]